MADFDIDQIKVRTAAAFADPRPGDIFHEMYSCWLRVLDVLYSRATKETVVIWQWNRSKTQQGTADEFRDHASYGRDQSKGYTVLLHTRGAVGDKQ